MEGTPLPVHGMVGLANTRNRAILPGYINMEGTPLSVHGMVGEGGTGQLQRPLILLVAVHSHVSQQLLVAPSKSAMKRSCHEQEVGFILA
jgi:hypothetical protein